MEIVERIKEHNVVDYDFMFIGGSKLAVTVDTDAGDVVNQLDDSYVINITGKPNLSEPEETVEPETIVVYKPQLAFVSIRNRKQRMPSESEILDMRSTVKNLAKLVQ